MSHIPEKVQVFESFWERVVQFFESYSECSILSVVFKKKSVRFCDSYEKKQSFGSNQIKKKFNPLGRILKKFNYKSQSRQNNTILRVIIKKINSESNIQRTKFLSHFEEKVQFFESFWDTVQFFESFGNKFKSLSHIQEKVFNSFESYEKVQKAWILGVSHIGKKRSMVKNKFNSLNHFQESVQFFWDMKRFKRLEFLEWVILVKKDFLKKVQFLESYVSSKIKFNSLGHYFKKKKRIIVLWVKYLKRNFLWVMLKMLLELNLFQKMTLRIEPF